MSGWVREERDVLALRSMRVALLRGRPAMAVGCQTERGGRHPYFLPRPPEQPTFLHAPARLVHPGAQSRRGISVCNFRLLNLHGSAMASWLLHTAAPSCYRVAVEGADEGTNLLAYLKPYSLAAISLQPLQRWFSYGS